MRRYDFEQYSLAWWTVRRGMPTASCFSKIITPKTGKLSGSASAYAMQLVADLYDSDYAEQDSYVSAAMRNGTIMEPEARDYYELETGNTVEQVGFCMTDDGRFGCSPDALIGDEGVLELKSPQANTHVSYLCDGGLPSDYIPQVHGHLAVTGRKWCDFMSYHRDFPPLLVRVERDDYTDALLKAMAEFWKIYTDIKDRIEAVTGAARKVEPEEAAEEIIMY